MLLYDTYINPSTFNIGPTYDLVSNLRWFSLAVVFTIVLRMGYRAADNAPSSIATRFFGYPLLYLLCGVGIVFSLMLFVSIIASSLTYIQYPQVWQEDDVTTNLLAPIFVFFLLFTGGSYGLFYLVRKDPYSGLSPKLQIALLVVGAVAILSLSISWPAEFLPPLLFVILYSTYHSFAGKARKPAILALVIVMVLAVYALLTPISNYYLTDYALSTNSSFPCSLILEEFISDSCKTRVGLLLGDVNFCMDHDSVDSRDSCIGYFADLYNDHQFCANASTRSAQASCHIDHVMFPDTNRPASCAETDVEAFQDICVQHANKQIATPGSCENLNGEARSYCPLVKAYIDISKEPCEDSDPSLKPACELLAQGGSVRHSEICGILLTKEQREACYFVTYYYYR
ncbi:hypothetical protein HY641_04655 [Candidatus Woesearchaeota archaeon]|nr:hypothetical protein [Candidatus Woesearchaeota archaeon]